MTDDPTRDHDARDHDTPGLPLAVPAEADRCAYPGCTALPDLCLARPAYARGLPPCLAACASHTAWLMAVLRALRLLAQAGERLHAAAFTTRSIGDRLVSAKFDELARRAEELQPLAARFLMIPVAAPREERRR